MYVGVASNWNARAQVGTPVHSNEVLRYMALTREKQKCACTGVAGALLLCSHLATLVRPSPRSELYVSRLAFTFTLLARDIFTVTFADQAEGREEPDTAHPRLPNRSGFLFNFW